MTKLTYFWECKIDRDKVHSGCGRVEWHTKKKEKNEIPR